MLLSDCCTDVDLRGVDLRAKRLYAGVDVFLKFQKKTTQSKMFCKTFMSREKVVMLDLVTAGISHHPSLITTSWPFSPSGDPNYRL